jgi:hypothetical protein
MKVAKRAKPWWTFKSRCDDCARMAVWFGPGRGGIYCHLCVPRGCSCQVNHDTGIPYLDEKGRELPCVDFSHFPNGWLMKHQPSPSQRRLTSAQRDRKLGEESVDKRAFRGWLRQWIKKPDYECWPNTRRRLHQNDLVASRLLKQAKPLIDQFQISTPIRIP